MKFLRRLTEALFLVFVFLLPWQTKFIIRPAINNFNEISLYVSQLVLLLALILFFSYQLLRKDPDEKTPLVWYFLAALELFILISFFFAPDKMLAAYHYFVFLGGLGLFYFLREGMNQVAYEESCLNRTRALYVFLGSVFLHAVLAIWQFLSQNTFASKYLGLASHNPETLGVSVIETFSGRWLRAYGGLDHPNILGGVMVFALLFSAFLLARKKIINSQIHIWGVVLLFFSYFFSLAALFFSFSRTAWLAYAIGMIILLVVILKREDRWVAGRLLALTFFSLILFAAAVLPYRELVFTRFNANSRLENNSIIERTSYLDEAQLMIKKSPLLGVGIGNYITNAARSGRIDDYRNQPVHNAFILAFAESGVFAFLSLGLFLFFLAKDGRRQTFSIAVIIAMVVLMMFDHWLFSLPFGIIFFFFILGLI